jgi:hypothetical protein
MSVQYTHPIYRPTKITETGFWQHRSGVIYQVVFIDNVSCFGYHRNPLSRFKPMPVGFRNSEDFYKLPEGSDLEGTPTIKISFPDVIRPDIKYATMDYTGDVEFWTSKPFYRPAAGVWTDYDCEAGIRINHIDLSWLPDTSDKPFVCVENVSSE